MSQMCGVVNGDIMHTDKSLVCSIAVPCHGVQASLHVVATRTMGEPKRIFLNVLTDWVYACLSLCVCPLRPAHAPVLLLLFRLPLLVKRSRP